MPLTSLYNQDNREIEIPTEYAILTDPPYGCRNNCDYTRFSGGLSPSRNFHQGIIGDSEPFDPERWLKHNYCVLFGYQHFATKLPTGTILVWNKRRETQLGKFLSDCELAWYNRGKGAYLFNHVWNGFDRQSERGERSLHPAQKPVALWEWVIRRINLPKTVTICDPYMGTGSVGIAARKLGYSFVGVECEREYFSIAEDRINRIDSRVNATGAVPVIAV